MSSPEDASGERTSPLFLPFMLLGVSVLFSIIWQIANVQAQRSTFKTTKVQLSEAIEKRGPQVKQADEIKARLEALGNDLLELAKTNPKAEAIVKKYGIERNQAAPKPGGP